MAPPCPSKHPPLFEAVQSINDLQYWCRVKEEEDSLEISLEHFFSYIYSL